MIAAIVSGALCIAALLRNFRDSLCRAFALFAGVLFVHDVFCLFRTFQTGDTLSSLRVLTLSAFLLAPSSLWLLFQIARGQGQRKETHIKALLWLYLPVIGVVGLLMSFSSYAKISLALDDLAHLALVVPCFIWLQVLSRVEKNSTLTRDRIRIRFSLWGGIIALAFFISDALQFSGGRFQNFPALGTLARVVYLFYVFQTFIQKELMTTEEVVTKMAHFGGIALMLSALYSLLVSWVGNEHGLFFFNSLIASFVIIVLFDPLRSLSSRVVRRIFLRRNLLLEEELNTLSKDLMGIVEPAEVAFRLKQTLRKCLGTEETSLFLLEKDGFSYLRIDPDKTEKLTELSASNPLIEYMTLRRGRPFVSETVENDRDYFRATHPQKFCEQCLDVMRQLGADFIIPFVYASKPVAFLASATGERIILSNEQLRLFIPVARQIAQTLKNAQTFFILRDRDKLAAVGEMAAGLAHEIKNPLGAIKGAAELLQEGGEQPNQEFLKIIVDETKRLSNVLTDFLDYAKPRRNQPIAACDPVHVIEHTANLVLRESKVQFELQAENNVTVEADPELLKQVFFNLFLNATQAMQGMENPFVRVKIRVIRPKSLFAFADSIPMYKMWEGWRASNALQAKPFVAIEISDNGPGIPPEERDRVFVPFYTTKSKGTGLGLAICQRIVEGMHGTIHVKSNYPKGTVFMIHLPHGDEKKEGLENVKRKREKELQ